MFFTLLSILVVGIVRIQCSSCPGPEECEYWDCPDTTQCPGPVFPAGDCRCCDECAKVEGEICGGGWSHEKWGACADGLNCVKNGKPVSIGGKGKCTSCPIGFDRVGDKCLKMVNRKMTFIDARKNCVDMGARLTTPTTEALFTDLISWDKMAKKRPKEKVWLGLSNIGQEDITNFVWENDERKSLHETWNSFGEGRDRPKNEGFEKCVTGKRTSPYMVGYKCSEREFASVCEVKPGTN